MISHVSLLIIYKNVWVFSCEKYSNIFLYGIISLTILPGISLVYAYSVILLKMVTSGLFSHPYPINSCAILCIKSILTPRFLISSIFLDLMSII